MNKSLHLLLLLIITSIASFGQSEIYVKTFGEGHAKPIVFLHGGPGYNSASFEASTAEALAQEGYFVIVYDRRGEGRSAEKKAAYTFDQTIHDLDSIITSYKFEKVSLIGHSFGGMVATKFAEAHPEKVEEIVYVGAPVNLQKSFRHIISTCKNLYIEKGDSANLKYAEMLEKMDTTSLMYASYSFMHAMSNGFYSPKNPSEASVKLMQSIQTSPLKNYFSKMDQVSPMGFWKNEGYTTLDLTSNIANLRKKGLKIIGIYGREDGLYSEAQINDLQSLIGAENVFYLDNCSHSVFIDQQTEFFKILSKN
ncbi:MAG: alpha/beta hydrolase [Flavobacteriales bacterium]